MPINNLFDFIDELEKYGRKSGTANENRAFVYNSLSDLFDQLDSSLDLYLGYTSIGITIPQSAFDSIVELVGAGRTNGSMIQAFAPTSLLPEEDLPFFSGTMEENFIVYSQALVFNPITGDSYIEDWYHKFDENMTQAPLKEEIASSIENRYGVSVSSVTLLRVYKNENL